MTHPRAKAAALRAIFEARGAQVVEPPILLSAETLLALYGEDIRGRAYVTTAALRGEQMLRLDFTVPVVQMHMAEGAEPARYTYAGEVFRRQELDPDRANEYLQVGYEVFDRANPAVADAEVFALMADVLAPLGLRAVTGDIGLLMAAVAGLSTSDRRRARLMRHIWRPRRFRSLLDQYAGRAPMPAQVDAESEAPLNGLRSAAEIEARLAALAEDAETPPIPSQEADGIGSLLKVQEKIPFAIEQLRDLSVDMPSIEQAVERLSARTEALRAQGVDVDQLDFEAGYGRTSMEYYDGFVFGFYAPTRADLPPVASGGRYDALTRRLGKGAEIPAVGAVLRPKLMMELEAAS